MAEKIISPGVFTNEIDQSFLPSAVADIGAALIGPTLKGPAGIPTVVTSFSDFQAKFGDVVTSGSDKVQFLTSHAAEEYLKKGGLSEVRVRCQGSTARIEIPQDELKHFFKKFNFDDLVQYFSNLGFNCTSLDLEGLISGKLNR